MFRWFIYRVCVVSVLMVVGCSPRLFHSVGYESDDMYALNTASYWDQRASAREEIEKVQQQLRREEWSQALGFARTSTSTVAAVTSNSSNYDTPYGRKLLALEGVEYARPESYYTMEYQELVLDKLQSYDPALYSATIDDMGVVTIEPKYTSSIYGVWSDPLPYYYSPYPHYAYPYWGYYSTWGYPRHTYWGRGFYGWSVSYYDPFYTPYWGVYSYPYPIFSIYHRPAVVRPKVSRSIVSVPSTTTSYTTGRRQPSGATVGTSTRSTTTNRGFGTTTIKSPTVTTPSSTGGGRTNAIGR